MSQNASNKPAGILVPLPEYRAFRTLAYSLYPGCVPKPVVPSPSYRARRTLLEAVSENPEIDQLVGWPDLVIAGLAWSIRNLEPELALRAFARFWDEGLDANHRRYYKTLLHLAQAAAATVLDALSKIEKIRSGPLAALRSPEDGKFDA